MAEQTVLGQFLLSRRTRLRPQDIGLVSYGTRRRVTGLRREELAQLAGVSASYYTRLEQGQVTSASTEVLDAIARALRLDQHEHAHLHDLAQAPKARTTRRRPPAERISPPVADLLRSMDQVPAVVTGRRGDILAWNRMGHALFAGHIDFDSPASPAGRPNTAKIIFLDPHSRELYVDWKAKARSVVEHLRLLAGRYPDEPLLTSLIGELVVGSPDFATLWTDHRVRACAQAEHELRHPLVGTLTITQQTLTFTHDGDQSLVVVTTEQDSPSNAALTLLSHAIAA